MRWDGGELGEDLADTLRTSREYLQVWTQVETIGPPAGHAGRMDVWALRTRWGGEHDTRCYEVKVNRSDFLTDVRSQKYSKYLPFARRVYFAVPSGLVKRTEVPPGTGLITRNENGWRVQVQPTAHDAPVSVEFALALLRRDIEEKREQRRLRDRGVSEDNHRLSPVAWRLGRDVAEKLALAERGDVKPLSVDEQNRRYYADELLKSVEEMWGAAGHEDSLLRSHVSPRALAEAAAGMMRDAAGLREVARYLQTIAHVHEGDGGVLLRKLGWPSQPS
jgi:hypothetical protein